MASRRSLWPLYIIGVFSFAVVCNGGLSSDLSTSFYEQSCPGMKNIVKKKVDSFLDNNKNLAGAFLRLIFHDCFVRGCDASLLLSSTPNNVAEIDAEVNFQLRGIQEIEEIKEALESECPGVVSCADIVALAARDAVAQVKGPTWAVVLGRRDGTTSSNVQANANLPFPNFDYNQLVVNFAAKGFSPREMIVLSGSHTIGRSHCNGVQPHLYNFTGIEDFTDPTLDPEFATNLKKRCPKGNRLNIADMDGTKNKFDRNYYNKVLGNKGVFTTDAALITVPFGLQAVTDLKAPSSTFFSEFADAMVKMSKLDVLTGTEGQIRRVCQSAN